MDIAKRVDHTLLEKDAPASAYDKVVEEAERYGTNVCVPPSRLDRVPDGFDGEVVAVVGFPHGTTVPEAKAYEARAAVEAGATEVDMACNVSLLKSDDEDGYVRDVRSVVEAVSVPVKAIIETGLLSDAEKRRSARLCVEAGAEYVKTCTGYAPGEATVEDVRLLKDTVGDDALVKASGGVRDAESALRMLEAGASRIGASAGDEIVRQARDL
ncbi:MAG: deoxyribose-phosphate aldolase [Halobacteriales archaeon]|nr:deoxyribose-phosphate aldolase [Halobacteriales archaeon]